MTSVNFVGKIKIMAQIEGGCLCGAVRYKSDSEPVLTAICHCKHCQKQAGSAFSIVLAVPRGSLAVTGAELKSYEDTTESGQYLYRKFCGNCGSPIISDAGLLPDLLFIKAGTLDDATWLKPEIQIWGTHQLPCAELKGGVPKVDGNPPTE